MEYFLKHPRENGMTYCEHLLTSAGYAVFFQLGAIQAFIHAFFPFLFETGTTDILNKINKIMKK